MRVAFDMTPAMAEEVSQIIDATDLKTAPEVFRRAFTLLRIHVDAAQKGHQIVRERKDTSGIDIIILPFEVKAK